jgi:hypothetical protein
VIREYWLIIPANSENSITASVISGAYELCYNQLIDAQIFILHGFHGWDDHPDH